GGLLVTSVRLGRYVIIPKVERTLLTGPFRRLSLPNFIYLKAERGFTNLVCKEAFAVAEGNEGSANHGHTGSPNERTRRYLRHLQMPLVKQVL
ncbi:hypothetical protein, partial [Pseudomonas sp. RW10S2]|uniref:hypothetical protein n=1 Tax=Pseudomonas sp. RW10S2 TaxID=459637 RepID=UPI001EE19F1C